MKDERLYRLYRLHVIDSRLIEIKNRADHLDVGARELALAKKLESESGEEVQRHSQLREEVSRLRTTLEQTEAKSAKFNAELFSGAVSAKEAATLQQEVAQLGDLAVETAIKLEDAEARLAPLAGNVSEVVGQIEALRKRAAKRRSLAEAQHKELKAAFLQAGQQRAKVEAEVEPSLLAAYNAARKRTGNTGLALITPEDRCSACGIDIAEKIKESVQSGRTVNCESCGRILFSRAEAEEE